MRIALYGVAFCSIIWAGCNSYSFVDKPSSNAQILSAARACLDEGNYSCAATYYGQLSSPSDESRSEAIFTNLAEDGVTVATFANAVIAGSSNAGKLITKFAGQLTGIASVTTRLNFFHIYQQYKNIQEPHAQGLVRFVTGLTLLSEIFAEGANKSGIFQASDLVSDPTSCATNYDIPPFTGCSAPSNSKISSGTAIPALTSASDSDMSGSPTLFMINAAIYEIDQGLNDMGPNGQLGSSSQGFTSSILNDGADAIIPGTDSPIYRGLLIQNGIGTN